MESKKKEVVPESLPANEHRLSSKVTHLKGLMQEKAQRKIQEKQERGKRQKDRQMTDKKMEGEEKGGKKCS